VVAKLGGEQSGLLALADVQRPAPAQQPQRVRRVQDVQGDPVKPALGGLSGGMQLGHLRAGQRQVSRSAAPIPLGTSLMAHRVGSPDLAAVRGQQAGNEPDQLPRDVKHDTIGAHAEPLPVDGDLQRDLFYRGLRAYQRITVYVRVSALMSRYAPLARLTLAEKTSLGERIGFLVDGSGILKCLLR